MDELHLPCCHYHVTYQHQLRQVASIHKSSPVASWDHLGIFCVLFMSTVNSDILLLSGTVFRIQY